MVEIITMQNRPSCFLNIPANLFSRQLTRARGERRAIDVGEPPQTKRIEYNLRSLYLELAVENVERWLGLGPIRFSWKGRGLEDFETEAQSELTSVFAAAFALVVDDLKAFNRAFSLFHVERDVKGQLVFDLSQDALSRFYLDFESEPETLIKITTLLEKVCLSDIGFPGVSIAAKKRAFVKELQELAKGNPEKLAAIKDLQEANCYRLWD